MSPPAALTRSIFPIHPSFRLLALAEPPVQGSRGQQWLNPEILTMFFFHTVKPLDVAEEASIIQGMVSMGHLLVSHLCTWK